MKRDTDFVIIGLLIALIYIVLRKDKPIGEVSQISQVLSVKGQTKSLSSDCPYCEWQSSASGKNLRRSITAHVRQAHSKEDYERFMGLIE